ncbi:hypothetical protein DFAR_860009 [Desulfarculales bacterium]
MPETLAIYRLPPIMAWFRRRWPGEGLSFITCAHDSLAGNLAKVITDLAFLLAESIVAPELEAQTLAFEPLSVVTASGHPLTALHACPLTALDG